MIKPYQFTLFTIGFLLFQLETARAQSISPLGLGMGVEGSVYALTYDSAKHLLYVGGQFSYIDGVLCNNIAVWDGKKWSALGKGINGFVLAIKIVGDTIYAGGGFDSAGNAAAHCIAMWNGAAWHPLGSGAGTDYYVASIESYHSNIYISGVFTRVDTINANYIAVWKKDHWESVGAGADQFVNGLFAVHDTLWAAGYFTKMNTIAAKNFAFYDGQKWNSTGFTGSQDWLITETKNNGKFYASLLDTIMHFEKDHWVIDYIAHDYSLIQVGSYMNKIGFIKMHPIMADSVADSIGLLEHDSSASILGIIHIGGYGGALYMTQADSLLYIGGSFAQLNDQKYTSLAAYDGVNWTEPARIGIKSALSYGVVNIVFRDSAGTNIYFGGTFDFAGGVYSPRIAIFNESTSKWSALGAGFNYAVSRIAQYKGYIYAVGAFTKSGAQPIKYIAKWNGTYWESIGTGANGPINDMVVYNGYLYIGGNFTLIDTLKTKYIAKFDGKSWHSADAIDIKSSINHLAIFNGLLYAGTSSSGIYYASTNDKWVSQGGPDVETFTVAGSDFYCGADRIDNRNIEVYKYSGGNWLPTNFPSSGYYDEPDFHLMSMNKTLFCMSSNDGLWEYKDNKWKFDGYNYPYNAMPKNDSEYYLVGNLPFVYLNVNDYVELNDVAVIKFTPPHATIQENASSICNHSNVFFKPLSSEFSPTYQWHFNGGFPDTSSQIAPIVKYDAPGTYPVWCVVSTDVGKDTLRLADSVAVENCGDTGTQKYDYTWIMGYHYYYNGPLPALDFFHNKPDSTGFYSPLDFNRTDACISDSDGNLMFFTNGYNVADASGSTIDGSSLFNQEGGGIGFQPVIILPSLSQPDQYYLIHNNGTGFRGHNGQYYNQPLSLDYSVVNMNEKTRKGIMTEVNQHIFNDTLMYGTMNAVKYANGKDWWLEIHEWNSNVFCLVRYTAQGFTQVIQDTTGPKYGNGTYISQALFSPDGSQFALVHEDSNKVDLFNFDRCKGEFQFRQTIHFNDSMGYVTSCSFSPNSRYLYISGLFTLFQFDTQAPDVALSEEIVGKYDGFGDPFQTYFFGQQLAPDGKIYIGTYDDCHHLHVINNPNEKGLACNFVQHQLHLDGYNTTTPPLFPNYRLGKLESSICDSIATTINNPVVSTLTLFPNPATTKIFLSMPLPLQPDAMLRVYDETGKLVISKTSNYSGSNISELDINSLRPGIYILNIIDGNKSYSRSFVKD